MSRRGKVKDSSLEIILDADKENVNKKDKDVDTLKEVVVGKKNEKPQKAEPKIQKKPTLVEDKTEGNENKPVGETKNSKATKKDAKSSKTSEKVPDKDVKAEKELEKNKPTKSSEKKEQKIADKKNQAEEKKADLEEKLAIVKDTGEDLADILDNLQIDESKHFVRRSVRKTASEILKEETDKINDQLKKDNDLDLDIKIEEFPEKGRGIVTTRDRKKGEFVVEYAGDMISMDSANSRETEYSMDVSKGCYMYYFKFQGKQFCVDATEESGRLGRLLNHSCIHPNLVTKIVTLDESPRLILVAKHDIVEGTELIYDYGDRDKATIKAHPWLAL